MNRCAGLLILVASLAASAGAAVRTADVAVAVFDAPDPVRQGQALTYRLAVTNRGPHSASNTVVTDVLPDGVDFVSCTLSQGSYTRDGVTLSCSLGTVAFGGTAAVTIVTTPTLTGSLTNEASISSDAVDADTANNRASCATLVRPPNRAPELTLPAATIVLPVGSTTSFVVQVQDPDHDPAVSITNTVKPSGSTFVNSNFTWTATTAFLNTTSTLAFVANDRQSETNSVVTNTMTVVVPLDHDADSMSDGWEWSNFSTLTNGAAGDRDGDGQDNYTEYVAGTQPTNAGSAFRVLSAATATGSSNHQIKVSTVPGRKYTIYYTDAKLSNGVAWSAFGNTNWGVWIENASSPTNRTFSDNESTNTTSKSPSGGTRYYRIKVGIP